MQQSPSKLKAAIVDFAEKTQIIPIPLLPNVTSFKTKTKPTEPFDEDFYQNLIKVLKLEIDRLYDRSSKKLQTGVLIPEPKSW